MVGQFSFSNNPVKQNLLLRTWFHLHILLFLSFCALHEAMVRFFNTFTGIPFSNVVMYWWMSEMSANICSFRAFFKFANNQQSYGTKSGE